MLMLVVIAPSSVAMAVASPTRSDQGKSGTTTYIISTYAYIC